MSSVYSALFEDRSHAADINDNLQSNSYLETLLLSDAGTCSTRQVLTGILGGFYPLDAAHRFALNLFEELGSFINIINATYEALYRIVPIRREIWIQLQTIKVCTALVLRENVQDQPMLRDVGDVVDYLAFTIGHETVESVRLLFLNSKNKLIRDELHSRGSRNKTEFYPQELVKRTCELRASALILAHNHPSGDPTPSQNDIDITNNIAAVLSLLGVFFHDHVIIGHCKTFSFRQAGLLR